MTTLDHTTPLPVRDLSRAIDTALATAATSGVETARAWLSDYMGGVGGLSAGFDAYTLDVELTKSEADRADLANRLSVLQDHVAALESDARTGLAIDWDTLRDHVAAVEGITEPVATAVLAAFRKAVQP